MIRSFSVLLLWSVLSVPLCAQSRKDSVYHVNYWVSVPIAIAGHGFNLYGQEVLRNNFQLSTADHQGLGPNDVWAFDRGATRMDPAFKDRANDLSDIGLLVAPVLPFTLALDKKVRSNFLDYSMMYVEMHAVNSTLYLASTLTIRRKRPFVYNPNVDIEKKEGIKTTDSFFSGHVSVVTSSTFFMTKVFLDHHPELKKKRFLFYSLASIPPIYTAYFRYRAGKHYPSDLIVGYMVGAATGILVPELHKLRDNRLGITAWGMGDAGGLRLTYKL